MKTPHTLLTFPTIAASFGGAESVRLGKRFAWVKLPGPGNERPVRVPLSRLRPFGGLSSFKVADIAEAYRQDGEKRIGQRVNAKA